jgi:hypothetical protein
VDHSPADVETELIDLSDVSLTMLRECDRSLLEASLERVLDQVDRPRANIGSSGPPGRVD